MAARSLAADRPEGGGRKECEKDIVAAYKGLLNLISQTPVEDTADLSRINVQERITAIHDQLQAQSTPEATSALELFQLAGQLLQRINGGVPVPGLADNPDAILAVLIDVERAMKALPSGWMTTLPHAADARST
eukprot:m.6894 g.6894  ORF g.6894 m.6894 type:complete len:134 (-) comp4886_c0_seq1:117-518(-)